MLVAVVGLALATLVDPASGQAASVSIFELQPRCAAPNTRTLVYVAGATNRTFVELAIFSPTGQQVGKGGAETSSGGWSAEMGFGTTVNGSYEVRATVESAIASGYIHVPCQSPDLEFDPPCAGSTTSEVRVTGRFFQPFSRGYVDVNNDGSEEVGRLPIDGRGTFSGVVAVAPSRTSREVRGRDLDQNVRVETWPACPPATTTTASSTTVPDTTTAPPTNDPVPVDTTTTTLPVDAPGTPVTVPPTVELPPPTVGATLTVGPELGPAGFVTGAVGTGFPPGPVTVTWSPGIGTTTAIVGPDGTFTTRVLVFPNDRLGPRALIATAGATTAYDAFLVVQSTVQPSGQDVQQINRIRRFNQR